MYHQQSYTFIPLPFIFSQSFEYLSSLCEPPTISPTSGASMSKLATVLRLGSAPQFQRMQNDLIELGQLYTTVGRPKITPHKYFQCYENRSMPHSTLFQNQTPLSSHFSRMSMASEQEHLANGSFISPYMQATSPCLVLATSWKNYKSLLLFFKTNYMQNLMYSQAHSITSKRSAKASQGQIIQNSDICRGVWDTSARKVGPKVQTLDIPQQQVQTFSWPETVKKAGFLKKS